MDALKSLLTQGRSFPTADQIGILFDALVLIDLHATEWIEAKSELATAA
jgi:hypothetical protein